MMKRLLVPVGCAAFLAACAALAPKPAPPPMPMATSLADAETAVVFDARIRSPVIGSRSASCGSPARAMMRDTVRAGTPVRAATSSRPTRSFFRIATTAAALASGVRFATR